MDIFEFSQSQASEPETKITKDEYIHRSKLILEAINKAYTDAWHWKAMTDEEAPDESVCDACKERGTTNTGLECVQDKEDGQCFYRMCDIDYLNEEIELQLVDIGELLYRKIEL